MKTTKRAATRLKKELAKRHAKRVVKEIWKNKKLILWAIKNAEHLKACSCPMCGNPRRSGWTKAKGKTRKELQKEAE